MKNEIMAKLHHQWTNENQNYICFQVKCGVCGMLLFEFVHKQQCLNSQERMMAAPEPNPAMGASSWYKPAVMVVCIDGPYGISHEFEPVTEGQDRNQVVTSKAWTEEQFRMWCS